MISDHANLDYLILFTASFILKMVNLVFLNLVSKTNMGFMKSC